MQIGERLHEIRKVKKLSQGDLEKRTGMVRPYISRIENGYTVPSLDTLEKFAAGLKVPLYALFFEGHKTPKKLRLKVNAEAKSAWGRKKGEQEYLRQFGRALERMNERNRKIVVAVAQHMAGRKEPN